MTRDLGLKTTNTANIHSMDSQFLRIRVWEQLSWVVLTQGFSWGCIFTVWENPLWSSFTWCWQASVACWLWARGLFFMTWLLHRPPECHHAMATGYFQSDPREPKIETALLYQPSQKYHTMPSSLLTSAACCWPHRPPLVTWAGTTQGVMPGGGDSCGLEAGCYPEAKMLSEFHG